MANHDPKHSELLHTHTFPHDTSLPACFHSKAEPIHLNAIYGVGLNKHILHYDWTTKYTDEFVEKYFYKDILPSDAREVAKIQFKDEVRESINIKNAQDTKELSSCVRRALKPYLNVKTKEALYVVGYASWLFDMIQKGNLNQDTIQEELKTPCLKKKPNGCLFFFKDIFSSSKVRY